MKTRYCLTVILSLWALFTLGQSPYYYNYNTLNGLPSNYVYNVFQDSDNFIWMATGNGLYKYDGFEFTSYKNATQSSLSGSLILQDKYGRIWYENFDGYLSYVENGELKNLKQNAPLGFIPYGISDKYLFVMQKSGVDVYDLKTLKLLRTVLVKFDYEEHAVGANNCYYFIVDNVLYKLDSDFNLSNTTYFFNKSLHYKYLAQYKDKVIVISKFNEEKRFYLFDRDLKLLGTYPIPQLDIIQGFNEVDGLFCIHTTSGVYRYDEQQGFKLVDHKFENTSTTSLIKDHQNNYWFATTDNGVNLVPELNNQIYTISGYRPLRIKPYQQGYLVSTREGDLLQVNQKFQLEKILFKGDVSYAANGVEYDTLGGDIFLYGRGFTHIMQDRFARPKSYAIAVKDIVRLDQKYYAISATGFVGLYKNSDVNNKVTSIWDATYALGDDKMFASIARIKKGLRAKSIDYDPINNRIVVSTNIGLFILWPSGEQEVTYQGRPIFSDRVIFVGDQTYILDNKGNLYVMDVQGTITHLNPKLKLSNNSIYRIKNAQNKLLIGSEDYIYLYDLATKKLQQFDYYLKGNQINDFALLGQNLVVLTDEGILSFSTDLKLSKKRVDFKINAFKVNGELFPQDQLVQLKYNQNDIRIDYSVLEFGRSTTLVYYRINGGDWVMMNPQTRVLQFPSLSYNKYVIEFKVGDTLAKEKVSFEITTPFWKQWWFYLVVFILTSSILFLYFRWQYSLMRNKIKLLNEKVLLEKNLSKSMMAAIKSQMNPHFFYNALNTIQAYIFTNDKQKANTYLAKFSKLTRIILEMSEKETISLSEEIESLTLYLDLERMRFADSFVYDFEFENITDKEGIEFPPMLLQPYVENAVKHGLLHKTGQKELKIKFALHQEVLTVSIEDNGIGRKRAQELNKIKNEKHQSFSTQANEKRLEILNQGSQTQIGVTYIDKLDEYGNASGTTVVLHIPV